MGGGFLLWNVDYPAAPLYMKCNAQIPMYPEIGTQPYTSRFMIPGHLSAQMPTVYPAAPHDGNRSCAEEPWQLKE